jgi:hypothetical protein
MLATRRMTLDTAQTSAATGPPPARGPRGFSIRGRTGRRILIVTVGVVISGRGAY